MAREMTDKTKMTYKIFCVIKPITATPNPVKEKRTLCPIPVPLTEIFGLLRNKQNLLVHTDMARGQQKIQSQQKAAKKAQDLAKGKSSLSEQKKAAAKALNHTCPVCKAQMPDPKTFKQHFENKHPKSPMPPELQDA